MTKKIIIFLFLAGFGWVSLSAQPVTVSMVSGKVDVQQPGGAWEPAAGGMSLPLNSMISTGFGSEARIVLESAEITIRPLTRMTIQEFVSTEESTTTKLFLGAGRIRADVKTGGRVVNDFEVRSPVATAAVRGTSFIFDGIRLIVTDGEVDYYGPRGALVNVPEGSSSHATEGSSAVPPARKRKQDASVSPRTSTGGDELLDEDRDTPLESARISVTGPTSAPSASLEVIVQ